MKLNQFFKFIARNSRNTCHRKMWIFILTLIISVSANNDKPHCFKSYIKTVAGEIVDSFNRFKDSFVSFFHLKFNEVEKYRQSIKKSTYIFIDSAFNDELNSPNEGKNHGLDPERTTMSLISMHGYRLESHTVITADGYILTLQRIATNTDENITVAKKIILLHHGLLGSSEDWVLLGPDKALPYILHKAGYDVWLTNARGNKYSKMHASKLFDTFDFWNFSFHEIGLYDLSCAIDYIKEMYDGETQIDYIGYSMGATALFVLLSMYPQYNHLLRSAILLAPLAFMYHVKGPLHLLAEFYNVHEDETLEILGKKDFLSNESLPKNFLSKFCKGEFILCQNPLLLLTNGGQGIPDETMKNRIFSHEPSGGSVKTILHYLQLVKSGQFQMFDYGPVMNLKKYGLKSPPIYRLNDVTLPIAIFSSTYDWLSTISDVINLLPSLVNPVIHHVVRRNEFSHTDFLWAQDAPELVYYSLLDILDQIVLRNKNI